MSVIATIAIPAEDFTLGASLTDNPGIRIRLERVVPVGGSFIPYFWASDDSVEAIEASLRREADIESFRLVDRADGEALVRLTWVEEVDGFLEALASAGATILEAVGESNRWRFQLRFDGREQLTAFYRSCVGHDIRVDVESIHNPRPPQDVVPAIDLTENQRTTLALALEAGYFEVPRGITLIGLAEELDISDSAVSQRLRRGISKLLVTVIHDLEDDEHR